MLLLCWLRLINFWDDLAPLWLRFGKLPLRTLFALGSDHRSILFEALQQFGGALRFSFITLAGLPPITIAVVMDDAPGDIVTAIGESDGHRGKKDQEWK